MKVLLVENSESLRRMIKTSVADTLFLRGYNLEH